MRGMANRYIVLNEDEIARLLKPQKGTGGFQSLMRRLQSQYRKGTQELLVTDEDLADIQSYAFDYKQGGWEDDLKAIFERHFGSKLGRE
jgi:hypothetical protein